MNSINATVKFMYGGANFKCTGNLYPGCKGDSLTPDDPPEYEIETVEAVGNENNYHDISDIVEAFSLWDQLNELCLEQIRDGDYTV